jgi:hypothetical protein
MWQGLESVVLNKNNAAREEHLGGSNLRGQLCVQDDGNTVYIQYLRSIVAGQCEEV